MRYVTDRQDWPRPLCAATKTAREFGALNTNVLKQDGQVLEFSYAANANQSPVKAPGIAIPGPVLTGPVPMGQAARGD
jgi:hypothetical protein